MKGKLIVIEGLDASGKGTQAPLLAHAVAGLGKEVRELSFPCYDSDSSALIKMYLSGQIGQNVSDVNAFAASTFYTVDRYVSYKTDWEQDYLSGGVMIANRYTTSNLVHQMAKLPKDKWVDFIDWLNDFEFNKIGIPAPDLVIYLDVPVEISQDLMKKRYSGDESKKDLHESDIEYLKSCRTSAVFAAEHCNWAVVPCTENGEMRSIDDIHRSIMDIVKKVL